MNYLLLVVFPNGDSYTERCTSMIEVTDYIHSSMRSQFAPDLDAGSITFHVTHEHSKKHTVSRVYKP